MASYFRLQLERWLKQIHVRADYVLDVGGGQNPVRKRVASWDVGKYLILDHDEEFKPDSIGDLNLPMTEELARDCMKADVVFCLEVMEYIYDPVTAHNNLYKLMRRGGTLYISYPTIYPLHNPPGIDYLRYSKNAVTKLLTNAGFSELEIKPRVATEGQYNLQQFFSEEMMRPIKGEEAVFDIGYLVSAKR